MNTIKLGITSTSKGIFILEDFEQVSDAAFKVSVISTVEGQLGHTLTILQLSVHHVVV